MGVVLAVAFSRFQGIQGVVTHRRVDVADMVHHPGYDPQYGVILRLDPFGQFGGESANPGIVSLDLFRGLEIFSQLGAEIPEGKGSPGFQRRQIGPAVGPAGKPDIHGAGNAGPGRL